MFWIYVLISFVMTFGILTCLTQSPSRLHLLENDLVALCKKLDIPNDHGIYHARAVAFHANQASRGLPQDIREKIFLASLLHDIDDHKFVVSHNNEFPNATLLLKKHYPQHRIDVIKMISLVSASKNGNQIDPEHPEWYYYPRWADRLEALGPVGIERAYEHTQRTNSPLFIKTTATKNLLKSM